MGAVTFCHKYPHGGPGPKASLNGFSVLLQRYNKGYIWVLIFLKTAAGEALWISATALDY